MLLFLTHKVELIPPCDIEIAKKTILPIETMKRMVFI